MKMKAIVGTKYGSPDVLQLEEVDKPTPKRACVWSATQLVTHSVTEKTKVEEPRRA